MEKKRPFKSFRNWLAREFRKRAGKREPSAARKPEPHNKT